MTKFGLDTPVQRRHIDARSDVVVDLPFPPSTNNLFANGKHGRYITQEYKDWRTNAGWKIRAGHIGRLGGPVKVTLVYEERRGRRDLDNLVKPVLDLLVEHKVIDGDHRSIVREINASWSEKIQGVRITISQAEAARAA